MPKQPGDINFEETIGILTDIFRDRTLLFNARWNCINQVKWDDDDFVTFAGVVNRECEKFKLNKFNFLLI